MEPTPIQQKNTTNIPIWLIVSALLLIVIFFNFDNLAVQITDINYWDEASYINRGREWVQGTLPEFSWSPLTSGLFALIYLPLQHTANWLPIAASIGRIVIFAAMSLAIYLLAKEIKDIAWPTAILGVIFSLPIMVRILKFQSDALFAALAAFALWQVLKYRNSGRQKHLWGTSFFLGLAALARNDGLILFAFFLVLILLIKTEQFLPLWQKLLAALLPFVLLVGGYLLFYGISTGSFYMGTVNRTWVAFAQGQYFIYGDTSSCDGNQLNCAVEKAESLYGTGEENNYSVLRGIANNPAAFLDRTLTQLKSLPKMIYSAYQGRPIIGLVFFAALGVLGLWQSANRPLLWIFLGWMIYLPVYFLTFFRSGYFLFPFPILFLLVMVGVFKSIQLFQQKLFRWLFSILFLGLFAAGILLEYETFAITGIGLFAAFWLGHLLSGKESPPKNQVFLLSIFIAGILLHGSYASATFASTKATPEEQAIQLLHQQYPQNSKIAAGAPGPVWSAQMDFAAISGDLFQVETPEELHEQFVQDGVLAIYVDHNMTNTNYNTWLLIESGIGSLYERSFSGDNGSIQVLEVLP